MYQTEFYDDDVEKNVVPMQSYVESLINKHNAWLQSFVNDLRETMESLTKRLDKLEGITNQNDVENMKSVLEEVKIKAERLEKISYGQNICPYCKDDRIQRIKFDGEKKTQFNICYSCSRLFGIDFTSGEYVDSKEEIQVSEKSVRYRGL